MIFKKTEINNVYIIEPELKQDERGYFARFFCKKELAENDLIYDIVQINQSFTKQMGTIRGMHFQKSPKAEDKIVQCIKGAIYDVAIDLRGGSPTYGKWVAEELTEENKKMLLIPKGCAHGFQTLMDNCRIQYFVSEFYSPEHQGGVRFDDPFLNIEWPIENPFLLERDKNWPLIK